MAGIIISVILAYLVGSISPASILGKLHGVDIRKAGSGNPGSTNTLRVLGKKQAIITLICDILKGVVVLLFAKYVLEIGEGEMYLVGLSVILGHCFPLYYNFKGGKGVATALGVILTLSPHIGLICLAFGIITILISRMVSLGSVVAACVFPPTVALLAPAGFFYALAISMIVIVRHRSNLARIKQGCEYKLVLGRKKH